MNHLFASLRRIRVRQSRPVRRAGIRPRPVRSVVGSEEQLAAAVTSLIDLPGAAASTVASRIVAAEAGLVTRLEKRRRAGGSPSPMSAAGRIDPGPLLAREEAPRPHVLALPFMVESMTLLNDLSRWTQRIVRVETTPLVETLLRAVAEARPDRVELRSPRELIRENLSPGIPSARRTTFVTFPDHHWTGEATSRRVPFFGEDHWFALLEPLLLLRGAAPILTLVPGRDEREGDLVWAHYGGTTTEGPVTEAGAREPLVWLASCLEATMRSRPASVLSWRVVAARSVRARASANLLDRNLAAGFIRAWRAAVPLGPQPMLAEALERLERGRPDDAEPTLEVVR